MKQKNLHKLLLPVLFLINSVSYSQIGGAHVYEFLNLANSARIASMGGNFLAISDDDITLTLANPSLINEKFHNQIGFSFVDFYTDINYGYAQYARSFNKIGTFVGTMQFIDYGKFTEADETGQELGQFKASEYALNIGWGRPLTPRFSIGSNLKFIYSSMASYNSFGMAVDVAGSYKSADERFTVSLIGRNIGYQIVAYQATANESLPFEIQVGLSQTFKHLPFRYSVLFTHLETWDLRYENPQDPSGGTDPFTGETKEISGIEAFADNLMRHIVLGGEIMIGKNFSIRGGYNYERRQELKVKDKTSTVGFSWGFGFRVSKFHFSYARSTWHLVGSPNYFTITVNLQDFMKKDETPSE